MFEITLSGPAKNALGSDMLRFLLAKLAEAGGQPVLLTGEGDAFSAGLNLKEVASLDGDRMAAFLELLDRAMAALYLYPAPTVALVNGHAIAGGCVLSLCCDRRVAAAGSRTKIGLNEVALGVRFPPRILTIVRQRVPARHLEEVVLGAGLFDPETAKRLGLIDEVVADAPNVARARLAALAALPADAYAATKRDLRGTEAELASPEADARFLRESLPAWTSAELKARILSVLRR